LSPHNSEFHAVCDHQVTVLQVTVESSVWWRWTYVWIIRVMAQRAHVQTFPRGIASGGGTSRKVHTSCSIVLSYHLCLITLKKFLISAYIYHIAQCCFIHFLLDIPRRTISIISSSCKFAVILVFRYEKNVFFILYIYIYIYISFWFTILRNTNSAQYHI
jgi:hypothetical protein